MHIKAHTHTHAMAPFQSTTHAHVSSCIRVSVGSSECIRMQNNVYILCIRIINYGVSDQANQRYTGRYMRTQTHTRQIIYTCALHRISVVWCNNCCTPLCYTMVRVCMCMYQAIVSHRNHNNCRPHHFSQIQVWMAGRAHTHTHAHTCVRRHKYARASSARAAMPVCARECCALCLNRVEVLRECVSLSHDIKRAESLRLQRCRCCDKCNVTSVL